MTTQKSEFFVSALQTSKRERSWFLILSLAFEYKAAVGYFKHVLWLTIESPNLSASFPAFFIPSLSQRGTSIYQKHRSSSPVCHFFHQYCIFGNSRHPVFFGFHSPHFTALISPTSTFLIAFSSLPFILKPRDLINFAFSPTYNTNNSLRYVSNTFTRLIGQLNKLHRSLLSSFCTTLLTFSSQPSTSCPSSFGLDAPSLPISVGWTYFWYTAPHIQHGRPPLQQAEHTEPPDLIHWHH